MQNDRQADDAITYFARTTFRLERKPIGIKQPDRLSHMYVIGKTGTGKSTLLRALIAQDVLHREGFALFDPHGDLAEQVVELVPNLRRRDLVYINVPDTTTKWYFNPLAGVPANRRALAAAGLVEVFKKIWNEDWGPRLEHVLRNVMFTLLEVPGASFGDIPRLLVDRAFRSEIVVTLSNAEVRRFWTTEFDRYSPAFRAVVVAPLQNKVGAFLADPLLRRILTGKRSSFDLRAIMDEGKILVVNLSKGQIGESPAELLGSLLVGSLGLAGLSRADRPSEERRDFWIYLDEFQTFATLSLATMLSELRKYRVGLVLAHQYFSQLETEIRDAVLGNAGTIIGFRVGASDAALLAREFAPTFSPEDLVNLPNYHIYLRLMIDGQVSRAFSAETTSSLAS